MSTALGKSTEKAASSLNGIGIRGKYLRSASIPTTKKGKKNHLFPSTPLSHISFPVISQVHRYGLENQILVLLLPSETRGRQGAGTKPHEAPEKEAKGADHQG